MHQTIEYSNQLFWLSSKNLYTLFHPINNLSDFKLELDVTLQHLSEKYEECRLDCVRTIILQADNICKDTKKLYDSCDDLANVNHCESVLNEIIVL
jgi:hypothetical protein